ncbi:unnamed protein product [Spodoptera exigua]|nr:unnamed protein product [Spodoptera exigua]
MQNENGEAATPAKRPLLDPNVSGNGATEQVDRDARLVRMFCESLFSYNIIDDRSWQNFFKYEFPNYQMPSVRTFLARLVPAQYNKERNTLITMLQSVKHLAVTINLWKIGVTERRRGRSVYSVTIHFIHKGKLIHQYLFTKPSVRNDDNIVTILKEELTRWNVYNKIVLCVASRAISAKLYGLHKNFHTCVASSIQVILKPLFDEIEKRILSNQNPQKKKDPFTWHSQYLMLKNIAESVNDINDEKKIFEEYIKLLKPFEDLTKMLSIEQYQSLSYVIPILAGLKSQLNECPLRTDLAIQWKKVLVREVSSLFEESVVSNKHVATFLDPRFKDAFFVDTNMAKSVRDKVINEIEDYGRSSLNNNSQVTTDIPSTSSAPDPQRAVPVNSVNHTETNENSLLKYLDSRLLATPLTNTLSAGLKVERYIDLDRLGRGEDPYMYWEQLGDIPKYKELFDMSQKYLCMPATAVPVETVSGEYIWNPHIKVDDYNDRKNCMEAEKFNEILFLHSFYSRTSDN